MELQLELNKRYSYADYLTWLDGVRRELIDGLIKIMSPAPSLKHQIVSANMFGLIWQYLRKKKCKVFSAPFDVRLFLPGENDGNKINTVVQPDICIICDPDKLDGNGCLGAPDLIIEIVSPNNPKYDIKTKYELYQNFGVKEYWIVYPFEKTIFTYILDENNQYKQAGIYAEDEIVKMNIFNDFYINLVDVFEE